MLGKICGTGSYTPKKIVDNHDLAKIVETNDEWIQERTGIVRRHIIEDETTVTMAAQAAKRALEDAKIEANEIDLILLSTISSEVVLPCAACEVQKLIGAKNATCFDLNAACAGFLFAYNTAQAYMAQGIYKTVLVIGSESLSNLVNWQDRGTCILFGDGAGAALLKAEEGDLQPMITHSAGEKGEALTCKNNAANSNIKKEDTYMQMDGQAVFKFAVRSVPSCIEELLEKAKMKKEEITHFILHQANLRIVEAVAKRLKQPMEKFPVNLTEYGNTSSASIPILLDELNKKNVFKKGDKIVLAGFGAGLSWGASLLVW